MKSATGRVTLYSGGYEQLTAFNSVQTAFEMAIDEFESKYGHGIEYDQIRFSGAVLTNEVVVEITEER